jgi:two-component system, OmpR family, sensor histidine kinase VicK
MATHSLSIKILKRIGRLSSHGILVYDLEAPSITYANKPFAKLLGLPTGANFDFHALRKLVQENDDFIQACIDKLQSKHQILNLELRVSAVAGTRHISCDAYLLVTERIVVLFAKDISKAREHSNYIVEFGARKDALLDMVSHNLSGPLNVTDNVLNAIDRLSQAKDYKAIDKYTGLIRENTQQCIEIINSFLKEEHLASEKVSVQLAAFDVIDKIKILIENFKPFNADKTISLKTKLKALFVRTDDVKFFQVVHNLISNSLKFTKSKGTITLEVVDREHEFVVSVKDNGIGIPDYLQQHLFKKNTPASRTGLKGEKSIGMGLYIVKKLTTLMGGELQFESEEGIGTTFSITLPKNIA